ncbi:hypothetical protein MUS_3231 [Bacillus sp. CN2]|uniref:Uncharacterized protein n=1 Tax=Bacillus amyloliquefaciens (strain Y2) TaxID=1155777 RepID=I2C8Z2_BACAY|nr:hypothetical protein MUS_3231 [Bacillus velezensis YAU B9601-Y2]ANF37676.1 hypothetical protein BCBMB205_27860 [Bacillus velezensis]ARZ59132.1 hypothetical protein BAGQ_2902 [Bacillus velezensis]GFR55587.1 hypothetical protein MUS_3231 [Bacillus sp. CN2]
MRLDVYQPQALFIFREKLKNCTSDFHQGAVFAYASMKQIDQL